MRRFHSAILLANGKVLVSGGGISNIVPLIVTSELYDPTVGQWSLTGSLTASRGPFTLTLLANGEALAAAGGDSNGLALKSAELYDPSSGTWRTAPDLNVARSHYTSTLLANGKVLVAGGSSGASILNSAELFDRGVPVVASVSAASYWDALSAKQVVAAFGTNFVGSPVSAATLPLQTSLGGVTVRIKDTAGVERLAPLYFVSPNQINYEMPDGTVNGLASVTASSDGRVWSGIIRIGPTAPSIFTVSQNGSGAAAAQDAITFSGPPFSAKQSNGQPNIITLYGTGLGPDATDLTANVSASVQATFDNRPATVLYAGSAPGFPGVNQFNIALPDGVAPGTHTIVIVRNGIVSNAVTIDIK